MLHLERHVKNIHPTSCEVIGLSHLSSSVRGKIKGKEKHPCTYPAIIGEGVVPHTWKAQPQVQGHLSSCNHTNHERECWGGLLPIAGLSASCNECTGAFLAALASCKQERGHDAARMAIAMVAGVLALMQQIIPQTGGRSS